MKINKEEVHNDLSDFEKNVVELWRINNYEFLLDAMTDYCKEHDIEPETVAIKGVLSEVFKEKLYSEAENNKLVASRNMREIDLGLSE